MEKKGSNHHLLKQNNFHLIKKYIYQHSPISRVEIAHELGLTTPTITGMVNPMIEQGLLRETVDQSEDTKSAGRPRMMLEFVPEAYYICGVDIGPYRIDYVLTDLHGNVVASRQTDDTLDEYQKTLELLSVNIAEFLGECKVPENKLLGIGVSIPGLIDGSAGKIYTTFHEGWTEHDLSEELGKRLNLRVVVENNVRARVFCSELFDRGVTAEPFAYFYVSFGVACQMIIDGKVLYGQSAAAGEIGHTVVQRGGPVCPTCGNRGCLEALAGERAIVQHCRSLLSQGQSQILRELCEDPQALTIQQILKAQDMGDSAVDGVLAEAMDYLGIALANTVNLIGPRTVVLDGRILATQRNQRLFMQAAQGNMFRVHTNKTEFVFLPYDPCRGARGAAAAVVREFLRHS